MAAAPPRPLNKRQPASNGGISPPKKDRQAENTGPGLAGHPPFSIVQYGPPGCGKTSMWGHLPDVGFLYDSQEEGILDLVRFKRCPEPKWMEEATSWEDTEDKLMRVANHEFDIKSLVVDSATGFEKYCFQYHCRENFNNDWTREGFYAFQQGPKNAAKTDWPKFLEWLDTVRKSGINVVLLAHSQVKPFSNPDGQNYDQHIPYLDKETWAQTHRWASAVIFYNIEVQVTVDKGKAKAKAGSEERAMYFDPGATFTAKNRWGMPTRIDAGGTPHEAYQAFFDAYRKAGG